MASAPHHRHQSSLEGLIDLNHRAPLTANQRACARAKFSRIVTRLEATTSSDGPYNRPVLVRLTYEYARSEESKDNFLRAFFQAMALSIDDEQENLCLDENRELEEELRSALVQFAEYLLDNFFLPLNLNLLSPFPTSPEMLIYELLSQSIHQENPATISRLPFCCLKNPKRP